MAIASSTTQVCNMKACLTTVADAGLLVLWRKDKAGKFLEVFGDVELLLMRSTLNRFFRGLVGARLDDIGIGSSATAAGARGADASLSILVVDDESDLREMLTRSFSREGHRVMAVGDGRSAIDRASTAFTRESGPLRAAARRGDTAMPRPRPAPRPRRSRR